MGLKTYLAPYKSTADALGMSEEAYFIQEVSKYAGGQPSTTIDAIRTAAFNAGDTATVTQIDQVKAGGTAVVNLVAAATLDPTFATITTTLNGPTPTVTPGAQAGTGATASLDPGSTDFAGIIRVHTGTGVSPGVLVQFNFGTPRAGFPVVIFNGISPSGSQIDPYHNSDGGSFWLLQTNGGPTSPQDNTQYDFAYHIIWAI